MLDFAHSSLRTSETSSEANLSSGNVKSLLGCPIHIKHSNTSCIPAEDPSTETLTSGHHRYDGHACCNQAYSAAAIVFVCFFHVDSVLDWNGWMLFSIMQQNRLQTQFRRVYKQSPYLRVMFHTKGFHQPI